MARARHKLRKPYRRRVVHMGLSAGAVLALGAPATAMVWPDERPVDASPMVKARPVLVRTSPVPMRVAPITRTEPQVRLEEKPPAVVGHMFATAPLNVRTAPSDQARLLDVLSTSERIAVTGKTRGEWTEVVVGDKARWVHSAYLTGQEPGATPTAQAAAQAAAQPTDQPTATPTGAPDAQPTTQPTTQPGTTPGTPAGSPSAAPTTATASPTTSVLSTAPCASGSAVETGLVPNGVTVHRAVCAAFPQVTGYAGLRPGDPGEHGSGHALDIMIPDSATGEEIAVWARAHASELGISQVIWAQHIWTVQRSSEGWRLMPDRGSATANHDDHVHITVY